MSSRVTTQVVPSGERSLEEGITNIFASLEYKVRLHRSWSRGWGGDWKAVCMAFLVVPRIRGLENKGLSWVTQSIGKLPF